MPTDREGRLRNKDGEDCTHSITRAVPPCPNQRQRQRRPPELRKSCHVERSAHSGRQMSENDGDGPGPRDGRAGPGQVDTIRGHGRVNAERLSALLNTYYPTLAAKFPPKGTGSTRISPEQSTTTTIRPPATQVGAGSAIGGVLALTRYRLPSGSIRPEMTRSAGGSSSRRQWGRAGGW
ncbi:hypothetical protein FRAHR75_210043 [Frankia sp. Hr75.2]|nr:hypothetical protein FRAHR75_210043 [Frankia sp. Hr75.2]